MIMYREQDYMKMCICAYQIPEDRNNRNGNVLEGSPDQIMTKSWSLFQDDYSCSENFSRPCKSWSPTSCIWNCNLKCIGYKEEARVMQALRCMVDSLKVRSSRAKQKHSQHGLSRFQWICEFCWSPCDNDTKKEGQLQGQSTTLKSKATSCHLCKEDMSQDNLDWEAPYIWPTTAVSTQLFTVWHNPIFLIANGTRFSFQLLDV